MLSRDLIAGRKNSNTMLLPTGAKNMPMSQAFIYQAFQVHLLTGSLRIAGITYLIFSLADVLISARWLFSFHDWVCRALAASFCVALCLVV